MPKWVKDLWAYIRFLAFDSWDEDGVDRLLGQIKNTAIATGSADNICGVKVVVNEAAPKDKILLVNDSPLGKPEGVVINLQDPKSIEFAVESIDRWEQENSDAVKILSIGLWTEGQPCNHNYRRTKTSKEHAEAVTASGVHKDYICTKCGHSYCGIVSPEAKNFSNVWTSIASEKKDESV